MPDAIRAVVLYGHGKSFCAGLDLSQHKHREPFESVLFSQMGHQGFEAMRRGGRPIIAALHGAVIGGGMEIAASTHVRVADTTAFFQLPEGRRGIYVGGGGSVHVSKIIGVGRMAEMMLTGRTYDVEQAERLGLAHYVVPQGTALQKAIEIADDVAGNAPICNYLIVRALGHIDSMSPAEGLFTESIAQAISLTSTDSKAGMEAFLSRQKISF
jgi:enoyl-CoA hydratase/carnithine racemase